MNDEVGPLMRFIGRSQLPLGLILLALAVVYVGYHVASGQFGAINGIMAFFGVTSAVFAIIQGRRFRRDPRFR